jgi:5'-3' exonuclease
MEEVLLIDGDSLIYYEAFKDQSFEEASIGLNKRLIHMCRENNTNKYIGFLTKGKCFRYKIAKSQGYKETRPTEKPQLLYQLTDYLLNTLHFDVVDGLEADDLVVYWNNELKMRTTICSPDKDVLKQTPGRHYNYRWSKDGRGSFVETTVDEAEMFLWQQVLMGDSTDCIPGLPGIGEKTAIKMLVEGVKKGSSYEHTALEAYIKQFGLAEGVSRFTETFKLVYMLRTPEDVKRETGLVLEIPSIKLVK